MRPRLLRPQAAQVQNFTSVLAREDARLEARAAAAFNSRTEAKALVKTWTRINPEPSGTSLLPTEVWSACLSLLIQPDLWDLGFVRDIVNAGKLAPPAAVLCGAQQGSDLPGCAGMACKTLALAARQTFQHLEQLLGDPCPGICRALDSYPEWHYGDLRKKMTCPYSWGHCDSLPEQLITDPCSFKVAARPPMLVTCEHCCTHSHCLYAGARAAHSMQEPRHKKHRQAMLLGRVALHCLALY